MKIERQAAMIKSVAKNMREKDRKQAKEERMKDKMYEIMRKTGKALDEVEKLELTKKEFDFIVLYIQEVMKCPISLYPNLK